MWTSLGAVAPPATAAGALPAPRGGHLRPLRVLFSRTCRARGRCCCPCGLSASSGTSAPEERPALGEGTRVRGGSSFTPIPSLSPAALSVISFLGGRMSSIRSPVLGAFCTLSASGDAGLVPGGGTSAEQWCCRPESVSWEHIPAGWASVLSSQTFAFCPHVT